jgi:LmbE family N-acetylglucosaminyl deacetylase
LAFFLEKNESVHKIKEVSLGQAAKILGCYWPIFLSFGEDVSISVRHHALVDS